MAQKILCANEKAKKMKSFPSSNKQVLNYNSPYISSILICLEDGMKHILDSHTTLLPYFDKGMISLKSIVREIFRSLLDWMREV